MEKLEFATQDNHFGNIPSYFDQIIREVCHDENIRLHWVSNFWVGILDKNSQRHCIVGHKFDLNSAAASYIADDKFSTYELLKLARVPAAGHQLIYDIDSTEPCAKDYNSLGRIEQYFALHDGHIVLKPNNGTLGRGVVQITSLEQLPNAMHQVFQQSFSASMCPFYKIKYEYRVIVLDNEVKLIFRKERGEDWRFNLDHGAIATKLHDSAIEKTLAKMAIQSAAAIGLRFCSVDIIEIESGEFLILEINSGVMIEKYLEQHPEDYGLVKAIYRSAIQKMFA